MRDDPPARSRRVFELFNEAVKLSPERRDAFLDFACGEDADLKAEVLHLLGSSANASTPTVASSGVSPQQIGPYRLQQRVGEGGMGEVWLAEQNVPIHRQVAIKVIKAGMDTKQVVARFEAERQALALMDHPAIAKVFDAGETNRGLPYFAMEYVKGEAITTYCDHHRLTNQERLKLFIQVCDGVQHAHQKGVIHRDLKPSNVLVTVQDESPVPKIIDFGVAKAIGRRLTEKTMFTELGVLVGTPEYMSPEQAEMTGLDIDTRTDVYALGIILYQLLVGALPFDPTDLRKAGFDEIRRRIREVDPPRPSTRISTMGKASTESARNRKTEPGKLVSQLKGDLDWITMKALEKDRTRRYGSPSELAADIGRHLRDEPVLAGPPSTLYRAGKFVRRHRLGVAVAAVGVLGLAGFAASMAAQANRIAMERDRAERISEFLVDLFKVSDPSEARGKSITAREILDRGAERIDKELNAQPEIQAHLLDTIGRVYDSLGLYQKAEPLLDRAVEIRRRTLGPNDPSTLDSQDALAFLYRHEGRPKDEEMLQRKILETRRRVLGEDDQATLRSMHRVAVSLGLQGHVQEAEEMHRKVLAARRRVLGEDHLDTLWSMQNIAIIADGQGRHDEAIKLGEEILARRRKLLGEDHPDTIEVASYLAGFYVDAGRYEEAEKLYQHVLEEERRVLGPDHSKTLDTLESLGSMRDEQGRYLEAEKLQREVLEARRRVLGEESPDTVQAYANVAYYLHSQGRYSEAEKLYRTVLDIENRILSRDDNQRLVALNNLAALNRDRGHYEQAEAGFREIFEIQVQARGAQEVDTIVYRANLADTLRCLGRLTEAEKLLEGAADGTHQSASEDNPKSLKLTRNLARVYSDEGRQAEAEPLLLRVLEAQRRIQGTEHRDPLATAQILSRVYARQGRFDEAEKLLRTTVETERRVLGESNPQTLRALYDLGCVLSLKGDRRGALDALRQAIDRGFPDAETMERDKDLKSLRGDAKFRSLVSQARKNSDR